MQQLSDLTGLLAERPELDALAAALAAPRAPLTVAPLPAAARPPLAAALARRHPGPLLYLVASGDAALRAADDLRQWLSAEQVLVFPASDAMPYEHMSTPADVIGRRLRALLALGAAGAAPVIVAPVKALLQPTLSRDELARASVALRVGDEIRPDDLIGRLVELGYRSGPTVEEPGELARRGEIVDLWPPADDLPLRLEFFGDELDSLRRFDPATQRSEARLSAALVGPPHEIPLWNRSAAIARIAALDASGMRREARLEWDAALERLEAGERFEGRAFYGVFFRETPASLLDHLPAGSAVLLSEGQFLAQHAAEIHEQAEGQRERLIDSTELPPGFPRPYFLWEELGSGGFGSGGFGSGGFGSGGFGSGGFGSEGFGSGGFGSGGFGSEGLGSEGVGEWAYTVVDLSGNAPQDLGDAQSPNPQSPNPQSPNPQAPNPQAPNPQAPNPQAPNPQAPNPQAPNPQAPNPQALHLTPPPFAPAELFGGQFRRLVTDIVGRIAQGERVYAVTSQAARLQELVEEQLREDAAEREFKDQPARPAPPPAAFTVIHGALEGGWRLPELRLTLYSDAEIFGVRQRRPLAERRRKVRSAEDRAAFVRGLKPGDYVVHIEHGIAQYEGLIRRTVGEIEREYLALRYAGGDKIYVPVDQVDRVTRYIGSGDAAPTLTRLYTQEWERAKRKARAAVQDLAEDLLNLYAQRQMKRGHAFGSDNEWQRELEASFAYIETDDQLRAIVDVKHDMEQQVPMDRLICGDVGFGKTEVALRAAFKAVQDGKQVAVLVPTTVLAQQHFDTFTRRMAAFPISVEMLSRFRSPKEQDAITKDIAKGKVDIVIGTHRLLSKDVTFKDLGLVVVDEEQRFGVRHKERLKQLRAEVDVLTLTATPIPRTLHMAMAGIRDLSVIDTPPEDRVPIKTYVLPYDEKLVREAICREIEREGQIYFVHNRVQSIYHVANRLKAIIPEARIGVGHGQLGEGELEKVMLDFFEGRYDVLVCTTIIESGLDVSNANTIIIDEATNYGLAQLYQLRGRVGRSANRAYAYLLYRQEKPMTEDAQQRLEAIQEATELGAGFRVAMRDLEIRGAGNLLGAEQSGHIAAVGFDLYSRLLEQAVKQLKAGVDAGRGRKGPQPHGDDDDPELTNMRASLTEAASKLVVNEKVLVSPLVTLDLPLTAYLPEGYITDPALRVSMYQRMVEAQTVQEVKELRQELSDRFGEPPPEALHLLTWLQIKALALAAGVSSVVTTNEEFVIRMPILEDGQRERLRRRYLRDASVKVGPQFIRLDRRALGGGWGEKLMGVLEVLAA